MKMYIASLTDHRVDIKFANYLIDALGISELDEAEVLIITNGMLANAKQEVLEAMRVLPSIYLNDDNVCWIPTKEEYPLCTVYSQFKDRPYKYYQVSKLAIFDSKFSTLSNEGTNKTYGDIYWGAYRPERYKMYMNMPEGTTVIGRRYPEELIKRWDMLPFTKDLEDLHLTLMTGTRTHIFGNPEHKNISIPYRLYEALMCGLEITYCDFDIPAELIFVQDYLAQKIPTLDYLHKLDLERQTLVKELTYMVKEAMGVDSVEEVLKDRNSYYGSYISGIKCRATMLEALNNKHIECNGTDLPKEVIVVFSDVILKLMRAASDPGHKDSWLDLAGYSKLIYEMQRDNNDVFKG